jgi:hypothetical protein
MTKRLILGGGALCAPLILLLMVAGNESGVAASPDQPIAFSHRLHAGTLQFDCQFCHYQARRASSAGVPSVRFCMGCHELIAPDSPDIERLRDHRDRREPVVWTKIYDLPDHVVFSHQRHVQGNVECVECHGRVETMEIVESPAQDLSMGWCIQCHRERSASLDCLACHH